MKSLIRVSAVSVLYLSITTASAQPMTFEFTGLAGQSYGLSGSWSPSGGPPDSDDTAIIPDTLTCVVDGVEAARVVEVEAGGTLIVEEGNSLTLHGYVGVANYALKVEGDLILEESSGSAPSVIKFSAPAPDPMAEPPYVRYHFHVIGPETGTGTISAVGELGKFTAEGGDGRYVSVTFGKSVDVLGNVEFADLDVRNNGLFKVAAGELMTFDGATAAGAAILSGAGTFEVDGATAAMVTTDVLVCIDGEVLVTDGDLEFEYTAAPMLPPTVGGPAVADPRPEAYIDGGTMSAIALGNPPGFTVDIRFANAAVTVTNSGDLAADGNLELVQNSGLTASVGGTVSVDDDVLMQGSSLTYSSGSTTMNVVDLELVDSSVTVTAGTVSASGKLTSNVVAYSSSIDVSGGTLTAAAVEALDTAIEVSSGTFETTGTFESGLFAGTESSITVTGGTLKLGGAYTGGGTTVTVSGGTLDIDANVDNWGELSYTGGTIDLASGKTATFRNVGVEEGDVYYVDQVNGNVNSPGTIGDPWPSLQYAANQNLNGGDRVLVRGGTYRTGGLAADRLLIVAVGGRPGRPITYGAYDEVNEPVILDGDNNGTHSAVLVEVKAPFISFECFRLENAAPVGLSVEADHVAVRRCTAHSNDDHPTATNGGIRIRGPIRHALLEENVCREGNNGLQLTDGPGSLTGDDAWVPPNYDNNDYPYDAHLPEELWAAWTGWTVYAPRFCIVRRSLGYDNTAQGGDSDGVSCRYAVDCLFEDNIGWGNADDNFDLLAATRCIARGNVAFDAGPENGNGIKVGVRGGLDNLVHHNVMFENLRYGVDLAAAEWSRAYNNTCYGNNTPGGNADYGIHTDATKSDVYGTVVVNNLCIGNERDTGANTAALIQKAERNYMGDDNTHSHKFTHGNGSCIEAFSQGSGFNDPAEDIDVAIPQGYSNLQAWVFIHDQVVNKLGLNGNGMPCDPVGQAIAVPGIAQAGDDIGAIQTP